MVIILILLMLYCVLPNSPSSFVLGLASSNCPSVLTVTNIKGGTDVRSSTLMNKYRGGGDDAVIKVLIPWKVGFEEFVNFNSSTCMLDGFSVQVFRRVLNNMGSHAPSIHIILDGDGITTPSYDGMIEKISNGSIDAIVADLTITKKRMEKVGFTLPYLRATLVMVTHARYASDRSEAWDFLKPFSKELWVILMVLFAATGVVLFVLEKSNHDFNANLVLNNKHKSDVVTGGQSTNNMHDQHLPPTTEYPSCFQELHLAFVKRGFMNAYWFTSLCVFGAQQESVRTHLGRIVTVSWLLVMFIMFNASYTASLTSLLSLHTANPVVLGVQALLKNENITVGYQEGSFMKSLLQNLTGSSGNRIKAYSSSDQFVNGLRQGSEHGGVDAIIDELPIVYPLLTGCDFIKNSNDDPLPSFGGYGFVSNLLPLLEDDLIPTPIYRRK